jgi:isopentenyldiphosphate isomerase
MSNREKWDTSVGGHVDAGESRDQAVRRELREELGIPPEVRDSPALTFLHAYRHENDYESELVTTWMCRWDGPFRLQESEISDGRFWNAAEIHACLEPGDGESLFTPNFIDEWKRWNRAGCPRPSNHLSKPGRAATAAQEDSLVRHEYVVPRAPSAPPSPLSPYLDVPRQRPLRRG